MSRKRKFARRPVGALAGASVLATVLAVSLAVLTVTPAQAAVAGALRRYPYLTDVVGTNATVNFGTDRTHMTATVKWGPLTNCLANTATATRTAITVNGVGEYQWKAQLTGLAPDTTYCYRPYFNGTTDLLGSDPTPSFVSALPAGSTKPFSFVVLGDWGKVYADGNAHQANLTAQIAKSITPSGARFAVASGDTAYPAGSQKSYGDLVQTGLDTSAVFGPKFWPVAGKSLPLFNALGNHAPTSTYLTNWPQDAAAAGSSGTYTMKNYCCLDGTSSNNYASAWYAFDQGRARFYILDSAWDAANVGTADQYTVDSDVHWSAGSAEYLWLKNDLEKHPGSLKFAVFHYPLHSDQSSQTSDTHLQPLETLLHQNGVAIAFNGHAHIYQRNAPPGGLVSYVTGGGGAALSKIGSKCSIGIDAYGIGWDPASQTGSKCGGAPKPISASQVYHFLLVQVTGRTVTVTPTDENGNTFDVQTYKF